MDVITSHYIIDLSSNNNYVQYQVPQGDGNNSRQIEIELIENGKQYELDKSSMYCIISGDKPDGSKLWDTCDITNEGYILINVTYQMVTVFGRGDYQVMIMEQGSNKQIKSFPFYIVTNSASFDV